MKYHTNLACYFSGKPLYLDEPTQKKPNTRKLVEQPWQQTKGEMWDEVTATLCNLDFIQAKAAAKMTYELVNEFNVALLYIPDNTVNILEEQEWQAQMDKYTSNLIAYSKGELKKLDIPNSLTRKTKEDFNAEINQIKTNPNRADKLRDFRYFVCQELDILHDFSKEFPKLAYQQAWYYSDSGPVSKEADKALNLKNHSLLLCNREARPKWNCKPQILFMLKGHTDTIFAVAITPNGKKAFSGSRDSTCIIWDLDNGKPINKLKGHLDPVTAVDMTPDGKYAISGSQFDKCILWDLSNGSVIHKLKTYTDEYLSNSNPFARMRWIFAVAITPDGKLGITGSSWNNCILWDLKTGTILQSLKGHTDSISALCISPDGGKAISGSLDKTCILWDLNAGQSLLTFKEHEGEIWHIWMSIDCKKAISWSSDNTVIHWDLVTGVVLKKIKLQPGSTRAMSISKDGQKGVFATSEGFSLRRENSTFRLFDLYSGNISQIIPWENSQNYTISLIHDGSKAISGGQDKTCILWNLNNYPQGENLECVDPVYSIESFANSPDGRIALIKSSDNSCSVWDTILFKEIKTLSGHTKPINYISISPNGNQALTASSDNTCILWDIQDGNPISTLRGHTNSVHCVKFTPDGKRAISGSSDGTCIFWDLKSGQAIQIAKGDTSSYPFINKISITSDGRMAVYSSNQILFVWDLISGHILEFYAHQGSIRHINVTPDNRFVISEDSNNICLVWKITSGEILYSLKSFTPSEIQTSHTLNDGRKVINLQITYSKQFIRVAPGGRKAISVLEDKFIVVWDFQTQRVLQTIYDQNDVVRNVRFSYDGNFVIIEYLHQDINLFVYDLGTGKKIAGYFPKNSLKRPIFTSSGILSINHHYGKRIIANMPLSTLSESFQITTIQQIWDFDLGDYLPMSVDCPSCCKRFSPPTSILATIENIRVKAGLKSDMLPCIELPAEAWEDPELLSVCSNCGQKLKFNPFIVYDFEAEEKKKIVAEEERKYTEFLENAENAFKEADWDKAFNLFQNLIQAEKFDISYLRFKMALCRINSLEVYKPESIAKIKELSRLLQEAGESERVKTINDYLFEREERLFYKISENAEKAFQEAEWDSAFKLYLNLIQAEKFDVSYLRFKMALCRINSLDIYKPEIIANIEVLKRLLQEAGEFERVQQINDKLSERLEAMKKAKKPWWKKF